MASETRIRFDAYHQAASAYVGSDLVTNEQHHAFESSMGLKFHGDVDHEAEALVLEITDPHLYCLAKIRYGI